MANPFDVGARRAEGRPAVDDVAEYVLACGRLGYQHQDLTMHPRQVHDWYDGDEGLDLRALDADCAALVAAAVAAEDAARTHTDLVAEMSGAWSGRGAGAAREFAWRSGQAATAVSSAVRGAADALATLRDELWRAVDAKVTTVQALDGRHRAQRDQWLGAAKTVTTGAGDLASASELVDQQVKPFVATDIGVEWIEAMRAAIASIGAAYDAAIARTSGGPRAVFDVPGELGPTGDAGPAVPPVPVATVASSPVMAGIPTAPSAFTPMAAPTPSPAVSPPAAEAASVAPLAPPAPSLPPMPSMGGLGGGAPDLGAGVSGFGQQLADLIGSLVGSAGGTENVTGTDEPVGEPLDDPTEDEDEDFEEDDDPSPDDEPALEDEPGDQPDTDAAGEPDEAVVEEAPLPPAPEPAPVVPLVTPESVAEPAELTPCEIAADELPQVGE